MLLENPANLLWQAHLDFFWLFFRSQPMNVNAKYFSRMFE